jgi:cytochrome c oxidase cbb3-type subunit 3
MDLNFTSDLVGFWNLYVVVIVLGSILFCAVFLWMQSTSNFKPGEVTGHVWDETLEEYSNPLPNWWRWMFYITIAFALVYLAVYPGLGNMQGSFGWTMRGQYDAEMKAAEAQYGPKFNQFLKQDVMTVAKNQEAKEMGGRLFQTYCAQCHGGDAGGATSFPNLKDGDWLWGGTPEKIKETIVAGRMGIMTPKGVKPDMNADQIKDVVHYVRSLSGLTSDSTRAQRGADLYPQACAACHQADGKGLQAAGYPNLTDKVWLHGSSEAKQIEIVTKGMTNQMPAFGEFLGEAKVHLLTAYVWGLGGGVQSEGAPAAEQK